MEIAMVKIHVDGSSYEVEAGNNLLHACLSLGLDVPYFCWHPALGSVGSCRQCAVKQYKDEADEQGNGGRIVMACMEPAGDGTRISIDDPEAKEFRQQVIEWLMINHPHDCPVCDEGGECHLQDMTVMTGHDYRRYRFKKRTFRNQDLGPFINHEMNRCITCYRCVRFYGDYAGGQDLAAYGAHNWVYFGRPQDGVLESEFSGNLVEVCPTGVFTDKSLKEHYTRKWDLQTAPSVCVHCGLGCNTIPGERYGQLRRVLNRYNPEVNGYFLCDRGRFGYGFVNSERRLREPAVRDPGTGELSPVTREVALECLASALADKGRVLGIGSPRASVEANFALRTVVGADRFFLGTSGQDRELSSTALKILQEGPASPASLQDVERSDAVFVLGEDPTATAPLLALALRQAVRQQPLKAADRARIPRWHDAAVRGLLQDEKGPLYLATVHRTRLDDVATTSWRAAPDDLARLGGAVAHALDPQAPVVTGLSEEERGLAATIAGALRKAERPLVVSGTGSGSAAVLQAAGNVACALWSARADAETRSQLCVTVPECNSLGLQLVGGQPLEQAFQLGADGDVDTVVVLENDLYRRAERTAVDTFLGNTKNLVVIDHLQHEVAKRAQVVLPAATFAEGDGTLVNNEGRAQQFYQVFVPQGDIVESWRWLQDTGWQSLAEARAALDEVLPVFQREQKETAATLRYAEDKVPRETHRSSGRTAMRAHVDVHEPKPPDDPDSPLAFSMEGHCSADAPLTPFYWSSGWNSVQALNKFQLEIGGRLRG
ncbi:MAG: NADH-quinone oxidoreductase subunit NuoG, partial [Planctomycetota bacterium]